MNTTATLRRPLAYAFFSSSRKCASSSSRTTSPLELTRSFASMTCAYSNSGSTMLRSKRRGRFWYAMRSASRKPCVVTSSVGSPLRSRSALVATVVPIFTASTSFAVTGSPGLRPSRKRMPATAASRYCSGFSERSLCVTSEPSGLRATMSVNVPPRSIQNCQRAPWGLVDCMLFGLRLLGVVRDKDPVGFISHGSYPFPGELLSQALDFAVELAAHAFDLDAMFAQLARRVQHGGLAAGPAARLRFGGRLEHGLLLRRLERLDSPCVHKHKKQQKPNKKHEVVLD